MDLYHITYNQGAMPMDAKSYTEVRAKLADTLDRVCRDHSPILLTRRNAPPVVLLSHEDYKALEETAYLLRSPANAARLAEAISEIEKGRARRRWPRGQKPSGQKKSRRSR